jgi:hypothetical protein
MDTVQAKAAAPASALALAICLCPLLVSAELLKRPLSLADRTHRIPPKHGGASETSLAAPELFTAVRCRSPLITHSLSCSLLLASSLSSHSSIHPTIPQIHLKYRKDGLRQDRHPGDQHHPHSRGMFGQITSMVGLQQRALH